MERLPVEIQLPQAGQCTEPFHVLKHARRERHHLVRLAVVELKGRVPVPVLVFPVLPDVIAVQVDDLIARDADTGNTAQQGRRQGVQLVQAQQGILHLVHLPAALGVFDAVLAEIPGVHQILRLLGQLGRDGQVGSVEAAERLKIVQILQTDQLEAAGLFRVQTVQNAQSVHLRHTVKAQHPGTERHTFRYRKAAGDAERTEIHPLQRAPVRQARAEIDLQVLDAGLVLQPVQRLQRRAFVQIQMGGLPVLRQRTQIRDPAAVQLQTDGWVRQR